MASSGSYNFSVSRDNIINTALQLAGIIGEGETGTTAQISEAAIILNMIVKLREADGMPLWSLKRGYILPFSGSASINTDSHVVTHYDSTSLTANAATSATAIIVTTTTGFLDQDQIGIELTNGNIFWTTVNGGPASTTINITTGLPSAAALGGMVYGYTAATERVQKPLRILQADILEVATNNSHEIIYNLAMQDYYRLGSRTSTGIPNQLFYDLVPSSDIAIETNGTFYIYPRFEDGNYVIEFTYHRPFQDFDVSTDTPDFPQAFYLPLTLELTTFLGIKGGVTIEERREMKKEAQFYLDQALETVQPEGSFFLEPRTS